MQFEGSIRTVQPTGWGPTAWGVPASALQPAGPGERVFAAPGEYEQSIPYGVGSVRIECFGAGGGGGAGGTSATPNAYGGGGGGSGAHGIFNVGGGLIVPGTNLTITVPAGGASVDPGEALSIMNAGSDVLVTDGYGQGGEFGSHIAPTAGGAGGEFVLDAGITDIVLNHVGVAGDGGTVQGGAGGNGGDAPEGGAGGAGGAANKDGVVGVAPGGGGGGAGANTSAQKIGGSGASGYVKISWPVEE